MIGVEKYENVTFVFQQKKGSCVPLAYPNLVMMFFKGGKDQTKENKNGELVSTESIFITSFLMVKMLPALPQESDIRCEVYT